MTMSVRAPALLGVLVALGCTMPASAAQKAPPPTETKAACAPLAADAKPAEVKLANTEALIFSAAGDTAALPVTLQLPLNVDISKTVVQLLHVRRDKLISEPLKAHFKPGALSKVGPGLALLKFEISDIGGLLPGAFALLIQLENACVPLSPVTITVERPSAALRLPTKVQLDVRLPIGFGAEGTAAPNVVVIPPADSKAMSALRGATLRDSEWRSNGQNLNASLQANAAAAAAGQALGVNVSPRGFPVGITTGKLELSSPDLAAPAVFDVEVHARIWSGWIVLAVLAGIGAGLLLREWMPRFVALRRARIDGAAVIAHFAQQLEGIEDTAFRKKVDPALDALRTAWSLGAGKTSSVDKAVAISTTQEAAKLAVDQGLAELAPRLATAQALDRSLRELIRLPEQLPLPLREALAGISSAREQAAPFLAKSNASDALPILDRARADAVSQLQTRWSMWQQSSSVLDADLNSLRALMNPARDAERGFDGTSQWFAQQAQNRVAVHLAPPDFTDLHAIARSMQAWRDYGFARTVALQQWRAFLAEDTAALKRLVGSRAPKSLNLDGLAADLSRAVDTLLDRLSTRQGSDPFQRVPVNSRPALEAAARLIRALCAGCLPDPAVLATVQGHVDANRFFDAVLALPYRGEQEWSTAEGSAIKGTDEAGSDQKLTEPLVAVTQPLPLVDAAILDLVRTQSNKQLLIAQRWQTLAIGVLTIGVSYAFFEGRFEGTASDLMGLFFWGLSVDLSVAGITTLQTNLATAPKRA